MLDQIAGFAVWCRYFSPTIYLATAVVVLVMALVLFTIGFMTLRGERWLIFVAAAFSAFAVQYGVRSLTAVGARVKLIPEETHQLLDTLSWAFFSNLNSILFLAAALDLLCLLPKPMRSFRWKWHLGALFAASAILEFVLGQERGRYPDGALSALCLVALAYALFANSGAPGRRVLAYLNFAMVLSYAALHVLYLFVPWFAAQPSIAGHVAAQWTEQMKKISPDRAPSMPPVADMLDSGVFGIAFLLKLALFLSALLVILRYLSAVSPTVARRVFDPTKARRVESLATQGILRAVGESIGSDLALLCFRLPGNQADNLMFVPWARDLSLLKRGSNDPQVIARQELGASTIGQVLADGVFRSSPNWHRDKQVGPERYWSVANGMKSFVNVPLQHHGSVIGCLTVEWLSRRGYQAADLYRISQVTEFLIPGIQAERWLSAFAQLRQRLQHYNLDKQTIATRTFLNAFARELQDVLGAFGVLLVFDFGFETRAAEYPDGIGTEPSSPADVEARFRARFSQFEIEESNLQLGERAIGKILLAVQRQADPLVHPSLVHDPQQREAVAALVKDCVLDAFRIHFRRVSEALHHQLDSALVLTQEGWLSVVESALDAAGLPLVRMSADAPPAGESWPAERMADETFLATLGSSLGSGELPAERFALFESAVPAPASPRVLKVKLLLSGVDLYLGIARNAFEGELHLGLPWSDFLLQIAEAADQALIRLRLVDLEIAALQFEVNELLIHELRGPAVTFAMSFGLLRKNLMDEAAMHNVGESARQLVALAELVTYNKDDKRSWVPLREVLEYAERIQRPRLDAKRIAFTHEVGDCQIAAPFVVASLVIMTLMRNARDAIESDRRVIRVSADVYDSHVECHVDDSGTGIPVGIRDKIFKPGFSTKAKGSGRGLPLARQTMRRQKGDLFLSNEAPPGFSTRFTIRFPRSTP